MLSATPNQSLRFSHRNASDAFADFPNPPSVVAVLVNDESTAIAATIHRISDGGGSVLPGLYVFRFDGTSLRFGDRLTILYRHTAADGNEQDEAIAGVVCARADVGRVVGI